MCKVLAHSPTLLSRNYDSLNCLAEAVLLYIFKTGKDAQPNYIGISKLVSSELNRRFNSRSLLIINNLIDDIQTYV